METKKNTRKDVNRLNTLWFNLGLFISLGFIVMAFEWRSYYTPIVEDLTESTTKILDEPPITVIDPPKPPPKPILPNPVELKPEEIIEELPKHSFDITEIGEIEIPDLPPLDKEPVEGPVIEDWVEQMPEPVNGFGEFYSYISDNLRYPSRARSLNIEGKVFVQFVVDEEGNITNVKVIRGIGAGCDEEVLRVMKGIKKWKPGKQRGIPVKVRMVIPIHFELSGDR